MQTVLNRIWTRVAVSISYDDNYYTTNACISIYIRKKERKKEEESKVCWQIFNRTIDFRGVVRNMLDSNIFASEVELYLRNYTYFWANSFGKGINPLISLDVG